MSVSKLLEGEIKSTLIDYLLENNLISFGTLLLNEYAIDNHSRRVDLVTINNNTTIAYEIKSEADTLRRIEGQIEKYLNFFDKLILVVAPKHLNEILKVSPKDVAVWQITNQGISIVRHGKVKRISNKSNLLKLMNVRELSALANQYGKTSGHKNRGASENILKNAPLRFLRAAYFEKIGSKYSKPNHKFWEMVKHRRSSSAKDISLLSLYQPQRNALKQKGADKISLLEKLVKNSSDDSALLKISKKNAEPIFGRIPNDIISLISA